MRRYPMFLRLELSAGMGCLPSLCVEYSPEGGRASTRAGIGCQGFSVLAYDVGSVGFMGTECTRGGAGGADVEGGI